MAQEESSRKTAYIIAGLAILIVIIFLIQSYWKVYVFGPKPTPVPSPAATLQTIPGWSTFSEPSLGVAFQYPPQGKAYYGSNFSNPDSLEPEAQIDLQLNCKNGEPSIFSVTKSNHPLIANLAVLLKKPIVVGGIKGLATDNSDSSAVQRMSIPKDGSYYLLKFITCDPKINEQILSTFRFL